MNLSSTDAVSFAWDFGDGITSEDPLASHQYAESGTYEVSLTITTADGCESTYFATINLGDADFTGSQQFSLSSSTEDQLAINNKLTAQPNPTSGDILIDFTAQNSDLYEINIISMEGQILRTIQTRAQEGKNQVNTDIDDLPAGLYLIQLQSKQGIQTTKVVKK
ncbi:MAG: PKD domain-containing protein [Saprospiraceae bacterium]|nr:PKD domain-containing protein [Saprospiraceae bacterium]